MITALLLGPAMILDAVLGEPRWLWTRAPHPVIVMGRAVAWLDRRLNTGTRGRAKGALGMAGLAGAAIGLGLLLQLLGSAVQIVIVGILLAQRSLCDHVGAVADALRLSTGDGRLAVARIVGRDTTAMQEPDVARAAIESAAENLSDGVIAPAFWFLVAGLPGLLLYKVTNTADSMIGHRTARYAAFGWAAARLDDVLNVIPARLTALLIALPHKGLRHWRAMARDARKHRSPNAGWPEAAMARALGVALAGPRSYHGERQAFPFVNDSGAKQIGPDQIDAAKSVLWVSWALALGLVLALAVVLG